MEESDEDSGDQYKLNEEPLQPPTVPAERRNTSFELEHKHPPAEEKAETKVHTVPPA